MQPFHIFGPRNRQATQNSHWAKMLVDIYLSMYCMSIKVIINSVSRLRSGHKVHQKKGVTLHRFMGHVERKINIYVYFTLSRHKYDFRWRSSKESEKSAKFEIDCFGKNTSLTENSLKLSADGVSGFSIRVLTMPKIYI